MSGRYRFRRRANTYRSSRSRSRFSRVSNSSLVRRARGNMRAANQQNDASNVVINLMHSVYSGCSIAYNANENQTIYGPFPYDAHFISTIPVNIYDLLKKSDFFSSYAGMYDQFRINSIKVKVTPTQWTVFDQSQSTSNFFPGNGPETLRYTSNSQVTPTPNQYIDNPNYIPTELESVTNPPKYIPEVPTSGNNYVDINTLANGTPADQAHYQALVNANYPRFIVNWFGTGYNAENQTGLATFISGTIRVIGGEEVVDVSDGVNYKNKYIYPQALTIVTAWDRTGLSTSQFKQISDEHGCFFTDEDTGYAEYHFENEQRPYYVCTIGDAITTYSSAQTKQLVGGSTFNLIRYLYPSSQQEKSTYYSTSSLVQQFTRDDSVSKFAFTADGEVAPEDLKPEYLTNYYESPTVPFKPTFLIGVLGANDVDYSEFDKHITIEEQGQPRDVIVRKSYGKQMIKPVKFNLEFDIGVTFRGLRKTQVV